MFLTSKRQPPSVDSEFFDGATHTNVLNTQDSPVYVRAGNLRVATIKVELVWFSDSSSYSEFLALP
jgi:hypothetical protein